MARRIVVSTLVFVFGFISCAFALHRLYGAPFSGDMSDKSVVLAKLAEPDIEASHGPNPIASAARTVMPAVVTIDTVSKPMNVGNPMANDPFFRQFFGGDVAPQTQQERGVGSGVLISPDGYIVTNNHVIDNAENINVTLYNGKKFKAKLVGTDPTTDIAVCKIDDAADQLPYADLGESHNLEVGDSVIAIGDPLNVGTTVTSGIISAIGGRTDEVSAGPRPLAANILQTDAAINPGNSGGALADLNGKVIGINEAIYSENGGFSGIGFAIPADTARSIAQQLIQTGKVVRPYIGIEYEPLADIAASDRQQIGVTQTGDDGAIVMHVMDGSPAADAGLQTYDVILQANRQPIGSDKTSLQDVISKVSVGDRLVLLVNRGGHDMTVGITVKQMPTNFVDQAAQDQEQSQQDQDQGQDQGQDPNGGMQTIPVPGF